MFTTRTIYPARVKLAIDYKRLLEISNPANTEPLRTTTTTTPCIAPLKNHPKPKTNSSTLLDNEPENGCRTVQESLGTHSPCIVITDINMPDMDGVQMAVNIQHINPDTKFIVLTSDTGETDLDKSSKKRLEPVHVTKNLLHYKRYLRQLISASVRLAD